MTIRELIQQLNEVPDERRDEDVYLYIDGMLSGYLEARKFRLDWDEGEPYNAIDSVQFRVRS